MTSLSILWFRRDLRLADNPALVAAAKRGHVLPLWIDDDADAGELAPGGAMRVWRHHALEALNASMEGALCLRQGPVADVFADLMQRFDVEAIYWNRSYEPWRVARDTELKSQLKHEGVDVQSFNGSLLWEPWEINKADGTPYKVFTPFFRKGCLAAAPPRKPLAKPASVSWVRDQSSLSLADMRFLPKRPWGAQMMSHWQAGEIGAKACLTKFVENGLVDYKVGRDFPSQANVSRLSPYLQTGELSPNQAWYAVREASDAADVLDLNADNFCSELGWREFSYSLLVQHPELHKRNLQTKFDRFSWREAPDDLRAWQKGQTGIPLVDAGMRELWETGYMHNRVRMVTASFLVKNLRIDWRYGEAWFRDTLIDADLASNSASWQWVAGCGTDAAPYFRVFNPITQGQKFDPDGTYISRWVPELARLPKKLLLNPSVVPTDVLIAAGADKYPKPIVDLKASREQALAAFGALKLPPVE